LHLGSNNQHGGRLSATQLPLEIGKNQAMYGKQMNCRSLLSSVQRLCRRSDITWKVPAALGLGRVTQGQRTDVSPKLSQMEGVLLPRTM